MASKVCRIGWLEAGALAIAVLACCQPGQSQERPQSGNDDAHPGRSAAAEVTIGAVLPMTGSYAEYGQNVFAGLEVAADEINRDASLQIRLVVEDDQANPAKAVAGLNKLANLDRARFVIGGFTSSCSEAMYPVAEWSGVLMFSPSTSTPGLTKDTPLFFRNWPSDRDQARIFADQTIHRFKRKSASILYSNTEYGVDVEELFREAYEALGGEIVSEKAYKPKATDFRAQIKEFLDRPAECIWLFGYYNEMGHFLKQARELGLQTQFFGQEGIEAAELVEIAGEGAERLIYFAPAFDPDDDSPRVKQFVSAFRARSGRDPDVVAAHAYDALHILVRSIEAVGPVPNDVAQHLSTISDYPGVAGLTSLDENGDAKKPLMVKTIQNGRFVPFKWAEGARTDRRAAAAGRATGGAGSQTGETPDDLARVVAAWPTLPEPIKAGIVAMVEAASGNDSAGK
jgi:branched-chain amino acid transport system substrate-binding protein